MEAQENSLDKVTDILSQMLQHLPKSCNFSYEIKRETYPVFNNVGHTLGMLSASPTVHFSVTGQTNSFFSKFTSITKLNSYVTVSTAGYSTSRAEYIIKNYPSFMEEADKYYFWPMYSELFTEELEQTILENPQKKV